MEVQLEKTRDNDTGTGHVFCIQVYRDFMCKFGAGKAINIILRSSHHDGIRNPEPEYW